MEVAIITVTICATSGAASIDFLNESLKFGILSEYHITFREWMDI